MRDVNLIDRINAITLGQTLSDKSKNKTSSSSENMQSKSHARGIGAHAYE